MSRKLLPCQVLIVLSPSQEQLTPTNCSKYIINTTYEKVAGNNSSQYFLDHDTQKVFHDKEKGRYDPINCQTHKKSTESGKSTQGCPLLHVVCRSGNFVMQFSADINSIAFAPETTSWRSFCLGGNFHW